MKRNIQQRQRFTVQHVTDVMIEVALYSNTSGYSHITEISKDDVKKYALYVRDFRSYLNSSLPRLKVLEHPSDTCLELLDRKLLKLSSHDVLLKKKDWIKKLSLIYRPEVPKVRHIVNCNSKM